MIHTNKRIPNMEPLIFVLASISATALASDYVECPGLPLRNGITLECLSTRLGAVKFNCSNPMPVETVAYYSCQPYYKEASPNIFEGKSIRCNQQGKWARYHSFKEFKCDYECGRALPTTKSAVVRGQLVSRTTWSWHVLIYLKLNWAKVSAAVEYQRRVLATKSRLHVEDEGDEGGKEYEDPNFDVYGLDPEKLTEIFDNDELSHEEILDSRYRYIYICGGTLISDSMVLTAAHCMTTPQGELRSVKDFMVVLGGVSNKFSDNVAEPKSQIIPVHGIRIADDFDYEQYRSDIAVVELLHPAVLNSAVLPACLPENRDDSQLFIASRKHGEVIGSMINIYREGVSTELKSKKLKVLPNIDCGRNIQRIPSDKEFCAGSLGANICSGDSGGGLIATPNFGLKRKYTVQGIISYARARRVCENYAVFTRVNKFVPWLKSIIFSNGTLPRFIPMPEYV